MSLFTISKPDRRWYHIILWWELRRIPYNVAMYFVGLASFHIAYVTIPWVYLVVAGVLNIGYACCWMAELSVVAA